MGIIAWIILGLVVGLIADWIMDSPHGVVLSTLVGIAGALLGGWIAANAFHVTTLRGFFNVSTWLTALVGAVVLLGVVHLVTGLSSLGSPRRRSLWH